MAYALSSDMDVTIRIQNATGAEVRLLPQGSKGTGKHFLTMDAATLPAGMYVVKFELGSAVAMRKVVVLE